MTLYETVISNLKGVIGSNKDGISINQINSEYQFITGTKFPLRDLGYDSIISFIKSVPNLFKTRLVGPSMRVFNVINKNDSESNLVLYDMILNTKSKKKNFKPKISTNRRIPYSSKYVQPYSNFSYSKCTYGFDQGFRNQFENLQINVQVDKKFNNSKKNQNIYSDVLVESDNEDIEPNVTTEIAIQTMEIHYTKMSESHVVLKSLEFVSIIVDIIVEFKPLNLDDIIYYKIGTDLYYYFNLFTGLNVDPCLFKCMVLNVLSSLKCMEMYEDLIYADNTDKYCCLNLATTKYTLIHLPYLEFNSNTLFSCEVIVVNTDGIIAVKFSEKSSDLLRWTKSRQLSEEAKLVIGNQQFWSWIPGTLCLVQLPCPIVKSLGLASVERAIIMLTEIVAPGDIKHENRLYSIVHRTTFYLIDHKLTVSNILSCSSSFNNRQNVNKMIYRNNDTNIAYVCNVSIRARCMPSKIQFLKIKNMNDVSQIFQDKHGKFLPNKSLVVYQIHKTNIMINFQPVYECFARINQEEFSICRPIHQYDDGVMKSTNYGKVEPNKKNAIPDDIEVIVISDSDDEEQEEVVNVGKRLASVVLKVNGNSNECVNNKDESYDKISVVSFSDDEMYETISISSSSNDDDQEDMDNSNGEQIANLTNDEIDIVNIDDIASPEKCIIPITTNLCGYFNGKVVRIMHLQSGAAVISVLESTALMKRELKMLSLIHQQLEEVINQVSIGDFFLWCPSIDVEYLKTYDGKYIGLVEIMQVINNDMVLVALAHYGLIVTVKKTELFHIPNFKNSNNEIQDLQDIIGPIVGAFDLHMIPNWYSSVVDNKLSSKLFTAFFVNEDQLVLEYFDDQCRFYNFELLTNVEANLTSNHCNTKSKNFISSLAECLLACRLFVGNLIVLSNTINNNVQLDCLPICSTLTPVDKDDESTIWFASINIENENGDLINKLSPHCFVEDKFCIDRIRYNKYSNEMELLDYQNISIPTPQHFDGIYKFNAHLLNDCMKSNVEFYSRYMLIGAIQIQDLKYLFNKLIF